MFITQAGRKITWNALENIMPESEIGWKIEEENRCVGIKLS